MTTSTIKEILEAPREFSTQHGEFTSFRVLMANLESGEIVKKRGNKVSVGDEIDYTIEQTQYGNKFKVAKKEGFNQSGGKWKGGYNAPSPTTMVLAFAKDLVVATITSTPDFALDVAVDKTLEIADKLLDWVKIKDGTGSVQPPDLAPPARPVDERDYPPQEQVNNENPIAQTLDDLLTGAQLGKIRYEAKNANVDADAECKSVFGCKTDELSKRAASQLIDHLLKLPRTA